MYIFGTDRKIVLVVEGGGGGGGVGGVGGSCCGGGMWWRFLFFCEHERFYAMFMIFFHSPVFFLYINYKHILGVMIKFLIYHSKEKMISDVEPFSVLCLILFLL